MSDSDLRQRLAAILAADAARHFCLVAADALCYVGRGEIQKAREALEIARRGAPEFIEAALKGRSVFRRPEDRRKYHVFLRVAAGLEDPSAADALR